MPPMRLTEIVFTDALPVDGYGPGFFRLGGKVIDGPVAVTPEGVRPWGGYSDNAFDASFDLLILGTGAETAHPPALFVERVGRLGIAVEAMASPAACRSYNMLLAEGRRVGLAVLPV
jgi:uncharacterized protein